MEKENLKTNGTNERKEITKRKDSKIKTVNGMKIKNRNSELNQRQREKI